MTTEKWLTAVDVAKRLDMPVYVIDIIIQKGLIKHPMSENDVDKLQFVKDAVWMDRIAIRAQMVKMKKTERRAFVETAHLTEQWQRYVFMRYANHDPRFEKHIDKKKIKEELVKRFSWKESTWRNKRIDQLRNQAQKMKSRRRNSEETKK